MLYAIVAEGNLEYVGTDHEQAQRQFAQYAKDYDGQHDVHLVQVQADIIAQSTKAPPPDKAGAPQLSPQELQQLKALLAKVDAQQKGTGK